jgi:hypothetical protein
VVCGDGRSRGTVTAAVGLLTTTDACSTCVFVARIVVTEHTLQEVVQRDTHYNRAADELRESDTQAHTQRRAMTVRHIDGRRPFPHPASVPRRREG